MIKILIDQHGTASHLSTEESKGLELADIGTATTRRASNIEPCGRVARVAFYAIRALLGQRGEELTRRWPGPWRVNLELSGGPTFGRFTDRKQAIEREEQWLIMNDFGKWPTGHR